MKKFYKQIYFLAISAGAATIYLNNAQNEYDQLLKMNQEAMAYENSADFLGCGDGGPDDPDSDGIIEGAGNYRVYGNCDLSTYAICRVSCARCSAPYAARVPGYSTGKVYGNCPCGSSEFITQR